MLFSDPVFIFLFLPIVGLSYYGLIKLSHEWLPKLFLICASIFFYAYWYLPYTAILLISVAVNFGLSLYIHPDSAHSLKLLYIRIKTSRLLLIMGICFNVGLLSFYKYYDFVSENIAALLNKDFTSLNLTLPLAISFFTFQQIAFLVDKFKGKVAHSSLLDYALFVTFFPQLIAGPIVHHKMMMPQFKSVCESAVNWNRIGTGLAIFIIGLAKKVLIADTLAVWANLGFGSPENMTLLDAWATSLSYTFQLYFDFSGYSDMALGIALMFGIRLPVNFNSPYKATNIQDFWRRWHITLSTWLRDYIYIPLGGNRTAIEKVYLNILVTFLIGGIWHGAGWTFVLWGALHGFAILIHRVWQMMGGALHKIFAWAITFLFVNFGWVLFRAETLSDATDILTSMLGLNATGVSLEFSNTVNYLIPGFALDISRYATEYALPVSVYVGVIISAVLAFLGPNTLQLTGELPSDNGLRIKPVVLHAMYLGFVFFLICLTFLGETSPTEFLYFNF